MFSKEEVVFRHYKKNPSDLFSRAYGFAEKIHKKHFRQDGSPYLVHPIELVYLSHCFKIKDEKIDASLICHDTKEEAESKSGIILTYDDIAREVDEQTAEDVIILSKEKDLGMMEMVRYFREIFDRVYLGYIKTLDRYSNMRRSMFGRYNERRLHKYKYENQTYILSETHRIIDFAEAPFDFEGKEEFVRFADALRILRGAIKGIERGVDFSLDLMYTKGENEKLRARIAELEAQLRAKG